jgi:anaerobic selenocysteine-containing dehydrogenase
MNIDDLKARGLEEGEKVDIYALTTTGDTRSIKGYTAIAYNIPKGSVGGYYPEMNAVVTIDHYDKRSGTPAYKGIPVKIERSSLH